jgi:predicted membrane channel-forming protein YqfA (hemolysin III family)
MFTASRVASNISSAQRSLYMLLGAVIVFSFSIVTQVTPFNFEIFLKWGVVLALFGNYSTTTYECRIPTNGIGLGSIVSALELPVSVTMVLSYEENRFNGLESSHYYCYYNYEC